ncbi:hypothetical protein BU24DRAFT_417277 [Aaosphaeria arxii CBS 175.79]|uniref:MFS general substrate transporter n=1 Tax=Aaosphaeria arxii CBS 175.79 TaxID=1450172 RepID=A0A6A5Y8H9_9PLEO|nr:uncharacterized protein BU24DRAFT_417277 [Aaosphaeria arxii CBS 175.79]KAF2021639.1 hypothetical protein BU24DRAFT_417277 [Aaosphaeria arxii CBS 175.79]
MRGSPDLGASPEKDAPSPPNEFENIDTVENAGSSLAVDLETEKRLMQKLDRRIIPMICWIYLMNFMDRGMWCHRGPSL